MSGFQNALCNCTDSNCTSRVMKTPNGWLHVDWRSKDHDHFAEPSDASRS